jgi:hypothetical protein
VIELGSGQCAGDVCVVGDEGVVRTRVRRFADAGLTDLLAAPVVLGGDGPESRQRTLECLSALASEL